ncbi:MAG: ribosome biogenesis GTPase YlqF [Acutalibacteraceae bacterium]
MEEMHTIQWFPGHMTRTRRQIQSNLKLVDLVAEIVDARIPYSSRNPDLRNIIQQKPRLVLMNKCDMADPNQTARWLKIYKDAGIMAVPLDCKTGKGLNRFVPAVQEVLADKIRSWQAKGMKGKTIKVMVVGIPNVGKSSFINRMVKQNRAKVEDRPGVTRGNQWFSVGKGMELLDTPGVLWPKFDDRIVGERLAFIGSVKDEVVDTETLSGRLLEFLSQNYPNLLIQRYKLTAEELNQEGYKILEKIGKNRGMLISGGEIDTSRAALTVLDEFRGAVLGKITLDKAEDYSHVRI